MTNSIKEEKGQLLVTASYSKDDVKKAVDKAINHLCLDVTVPGYRKGKAPVSTASKYLRNEAINNETINQLLRLYDKNFEADAALSGYFKENKVVNFRPEVSVQKFSADGAEILITYVLRPYVSKLGEYKGLKSEAQKREINDADVEKELKRLAENEAELAPKDKEAENGDTANIDFVGLMDGKEFDGGSAKSFDLVLGSNQFVPGFEAQVVGHKAGDKFDVSLTMPDNYPAPLTSKPVVFKVTLNSVKVKEIPEINDDFATTLSGEYASKDLNDLKNKVVSHLNKDAENEYLNKILNDLLLQVRNNSEFVVSDKFVDIQVDSRIKQDEQNILNQGLTLDEYLKLIKKNKDEYRKEITDGVLAEIKNSLVYDEIAKAEKLPAVQNKDIEAVLGSTIDEFVKGYSGYLRASKMSEEQIGNQINGYLNQIFTSIMTHRVQDRVLILNGYKEEEKAEEKAEEEKKEEIKEEVKAEEAKAE